MSRYDDDTIECVLIAETVRRSRKTRRCNFCSGTITIGERYRRYVQKVDGEMCVTEGCLDSPHCLDFDR